MRLIDADELKRKFYYSEGTSEKDKAWIATIRRYINEAPTVYNFQREFEFLLKKFKYLDDYASGLISKDDFINNWISKE
jgi:hypothetical protein